MEALSCELIEKALQLTGKTFFDMFEIQSCLYNGTPLTEFSIERFFYYILSPEFIEKYIPIFIKEFYIGEYNPDYDTSPVTLSYQYYGEAIGEYQKGNSQQLIDLLSKI